MLSTNMYQRRNAVARIQRDSWVGEHNPVTPSPASSSSSSSSSTPATPVEPITIDSVIVTNLVNEILVDELYNLQAEYSANMLLFGAPNRAAEEKGKPLQAPHNSPVIFRPISRKPIPVLDLENIPLMDENSNPARSPRPSSRILFTKE